MNEYFIRSININPFGSNRQQDHDNLQRAINDKGWETGAERRAIDALELFEKRRIERIISVLSWLLNFRR